jgi:hypothetical protein
VIRRIQDMRKQLDLAVEDNINVKASMGDKRVLALIMDNAFIAMISDEVRAKLFGFSKDGAAPDTSCFTSVKEGMSRALL